MTRREEVPLGDLLRIVLLSRGPMKRDAIRVYFFGRHSWGAKKTRAMLSAAMLSGGVVGERGLFWARLPR